MGVLTLKQVEKSLKEKDLILRDHQIVGINTILDWYNAGHGGILADEMGLGKTCQAIVAISMLMTSTKKSPCLVICPLSVLDHWSNEIERFSCGVMKVFRYYDTRPNRISVREELKKMDWNVLLTTYDTFLNDHNMLHYVWEFVIFDESQRVKNIDAQLTQALRNSQIEWMLSMTGTPVQNDMTELYSLLNLADGARFPINGLEEFLQKYASFKDEKRTQEFHTLFDNYCLRRSKSILHDIPPCEEITLYHGMTDIQRKLYTAILANNREFFEEQTSNKQCANQSLIFILVQLRKAVCHPYLFKGFEKQPFVDGDHLRDVSGKVLIIERLLKYLVKRKHKVLIFSTLVIFLDILYDYLQWKGYEVLQLDGHTKQTDRQEYVEQFQKKGSKVSAFLLSTRAGGVGLNLMAADTVIFVDWDHNPQVDKQAAARCHRIGQKKPVKIIRLVAKHTVDEIIRSRAARKIILSHNVMGTKDDVVRSKIDFTKLLLKGLKKLTTAKDETVATVEALTDADLEAIVGRTLKNGLWEIKNNGATVDNDDDNDTKENVTLGSQNNTLSSQSPTKYEDLTTRAIYKYEGHDYAEDRMVLTKITNSLHMGIKINKNGDIEVIPDDDPATTRPVRSRPERRIITEEEKEQILLAIREKKDLARRVALEKREKLWRENNYQSLNLESVDINQIVERKPKPGKMYSVTGDLAKPVNFEDRNDKMKIIVHCVASLVNFPSHRGVGKVLRKLDEKIPAAFDLARSMRDVTPGDCHLITVNENSSEKLAVGLMACINYPHGLHNNPRMCALYLERALCRVGAYAQRNSSSVHMAQIWAGQVLRESDVRYLIRKTLCLRYGVDVYIYHYRRGGASGDAGDAPSTSSTIVGGNVDSASESKPKPAKRPKMCTKTDGTQIVEDFSKTTRVDSRRLDRQMMSNSPDSSDTDLILSDDNDD